MTAVPPATSVLERDWGFVIGGDVINGVRGEREDVVNPATGEVFASLPVASADDVDRAVEAGRAAFPAWRRSPAGERGALVSRIADAIDAHAEELALLDTTDNGSPLAMMRGDVSLALAQLRYFAGLALEVRGQTIPTPDNASIDFTTWEPYGVVARIVPFNHPLMFAATKIAAPLIAGNTVVLKPSEHTSLSALRIGELCAEILPPGVVNVITGPGRTVGSHLVEHPDVPRIAFTGSVGVGLQIQRLAAASGCVKVVTLELGGKNPLIVFDDADPDAAIAGALRGMNFTWQGQSCGSTSRIYVHRSLFDRVIDGLAAAMNDLIVGDPLDPRSDLGAIVSRSQFDAVAGFADRGRMEPGSRLLAGGCPGDGPGFFFRPTLFALDDDRDSPLASTEIFGPIVVAIPFDSYDSVIQRANALPLGLTASVWTRNLDTAMRAIRDIEAGYVWVNSSSHHIPGVPFGGVKNSGVGREEGIEELYSYAQQKNVYLGFDLNGGAV